MNIDSDAYAKARNSFMAVAVISGLMAAMALVDSNAAGAGGFGLAALLSVLVMRLLRPEGRGELLSWFQPKPRARKTK